MFLSPAGAAGPGTGDIAMPPVRPSVCPSVRPSVCLSVRPSRLVFALTQKCIAVFSRNYQVMGVCCIDFDIDGMLFEFFMNFL